MDISEVKPRRAWRRHSAEFKAQVIKECDHPGVSVAAVARANGLNANLLRNWLVAEKKLPATKTAFLPLPIAVSDPSPDVVIEIRRGAAIVQIRWPMSAAAECGSWLRTWLK